MKREQQANALISQLILNAIASGKTTAEAIDEVCGAGTFSNLVDELYSELRAKAK